MRKKEWTDSGQCLFVTILLSRRKKRRTPRDEGSPAARRTLTQPSTNTLGIKAVALSLQLLFMLPVAQHTSIIIHNPFLVGSYSCCCPSNNYYILTKHIGLQRRKPFLVAFYHPRHAAARRPIFKSSQTHCASKQKVLPFLVRFWPAQLKIIIFDQSRRPIEIRKGREVRKGKIVLEKQV
jgi:hypothetical protein